MTPESVEIITSFERQSFYHCAFLSVRYACLGDNYKGYFLVLLTNR